jgi:hypothetical protein
MMIVGVSIYVPQISLVRKKEDGTKSLPTILRSKKNPAKFGVARHHPLNKLGYNRLYAKGP